MDGWMDQLHLFRPVKGKNSEQLNHYLEMDNMDHCRLLRLGLERCESRPPVGCYPNGPTLSTETLSERPVAKKTSIDINETQIIRSVLQERGG
jgi:hypothetical protein